MQDQGAQPASKPGPSKFDQTLKSQGTEGPEKAQGPTAAADVKHVEKAQQIREMDRARHLDGMDRSHNKPGNKSATGRMDPVTQKSGVNKSTSMLMGLVQNIEKGQASMDKLINGSLNGKTFSNSEMLGLQAGMYKYTQELELTGKVVEKATSGLKDTLKTQV
jgi:hypothetical protein